MEHRRDQLSRQAYGKLGYRKGEDGKPEIVPEEAEIVRNIFDWFLSGKTPREIVEMSVYNQAHGSILPMQKDMSSSISFRCCIPK